MSIFSRFFRNKTTQAVAATIDRPPVRTRVPVPFGLNPGSIYTVPVVELAVAQADGSMLQIPQGDLVVHQVGKSRLFGLDVYTIWFEGQECFLQAVCEPNNLTKIKQLRMFGLYKKITPQSVPDWEFWLGGIQRDERGHPVYDVAGKPMKGEAALIGYPQFQIDEPRIAMYNRQWPSAQNEPIQVVETVEDNTGKQILIKHECMEYARNLTTHKDSTVEYLFVTARGDIGEVQVYLGLDLDPTNQTIISVA